MNKMGENQKYNFLHLELGSTVVGEAFRSIEASQCCSTSE